MSDIERGLTRALTGAFTVSLPLDLLNDHRIVILSDQHKGGGRSGDDFRQCKPGYLGALGHYLEAGFTLVLLGDCEELWEERFSRILAAHRDVFDLEASFPASRYYRIWGNHDDKWQKERTVKRHLSRFMPTDAVYEGLRFRVTAGDGELGTLLMVHGHQGTLFSEKLGWFSRLFLPAYRIIWQGWFGLGKTTPARDECLRGDHDRQMYEWAVAQDRLILVAGHTHRPVWSSQTHLQQLTHDLALAMNEPASSERDERIRLLEAAVDRETAESPPCNDVFRTAPVYFNTGCCRFADGDITGLEIEAGEVRLIKWSSQPAVERTVLQSGGLARFFGRLEGIRGDS